MVITFPSKSTKTNQNIYNSNKAKRYFIIVVKALKNENKNLPINNAINTRKVPSHSSLGYRTENNANSGQCSEGHTCQCLRPWPGQARLFCAGVLLQGLAREKL